MACTPCGDTRQGLFIIVVTQDDPVGTGTSNDGFMCLMRPFVDCTVRHDVVGVWQLPNDHATPRNIYSDI